MASLMKTPKMPKPPAEVAMPDPEDMKARMAKRAQMFDATRRRGRQSTILGPTVAEGGGGKEYSGSTLGGGAA